MTETALKLKETPRILCIGLSQKNSEVLTPIIAGCDITKAALDLEQLMTPLPVEPHVIIIEHADPNISLTEIAQVVRMNYINAEVFLLTEARAGYDRALFKKNGFTEAFMMPFDRDLYVQTVKDSTAKASKGEIKSYRSVKMIDMEPGSVIDFETRIYLPSNNRYITFFTPGDPVDAARLERLKKHEVKNMYVNVNDMPKFYSYTANKLKSISNSKKLSETEKKEKLTSAVRDLMGQLFSDEGDAASFDTGKKLIHDCGQIVKSFLTSTEAGGSAEWYQKILALTGERTLTYHHASNVSTFAALFSIGLGIGKPEDLALAGLLHDIGLVEIPSEIVNKDESEMAPEELEIYKKHPEKSVDMIKAKRIVVSERIMKIIFQHHEKINGRGFPKGLEGTRIIPEAQILGIADRFDELTSLKEGQTPLSPRQAIESLKMESMRDPTKLSFDPEIIKKLLQLFPK